MHMSSLNVLTRVNNIGMKIWAEEGSDTKYVSLTFKLHESYQLTPWPDELSWQTPRVNQFIYKDNENTGSRHELHITITWEHVQLLTLNFIPDHLDRDVWE